MYIHAYTLIHTLTHSPTHSLTHSHTLIHTLTHTQGVDGHSDSSLSTSVPGGSGEVPRLSASGSQQPQQQPQSLHQQPQQQNPNSVTYINPLHHSPNFDAEQQGALADGAQMNGHSQQKQQQKQQQWQHAQQQPRHPQLPGYAHRYPPPPYDYNHQYVNDRASSEPSHGAR